MVCVLVLALVNFSLLSSIQAVPLPIVMPRSREELKSGVTTASGSGSGSGSGLHIRRRREVHYEAFVQEARASASCSPVNCIIFSVLVHFWSPPHFKILPHFHTAQDGRFRKTIHWDVVGPVRFACFFIPGAPVEFNTVFGLNFVGPYCRTRTRVSKP